MKLSGLWQEISVSVHREAEEAVTHFLTNCGVAGVVVEDALVWQEAQAKGWGDYFSDDRPVVTNHVVIKAYVVEGVEITGALLGFLDRLPDFGLEVGHAQLSVTVVREEDWANCWQQHYHVKRIGQVVIQPSWRSSDPEQGQSVVVLDPGMAFGTGDHPSTVLCIEWLQDVDLLGKTVWDVGCGSGILSIVAAQRQAAHVQAADTDPVAVQVSRSNFQRNNVSVTLVQGSLADLVGTADVIVANIIADVIIDMFPEVSSRLARLGTFVASGIISERVADVRQTARRLGFLVVDERYHDEWAMISFRKDCDACAKCL